MGFGSAYSERYQMFAKGDRVKVKNTASDTMLRGKYGTVKQIDLMGSCRIFFKKFGEYDIPMEHLEKA